MKKPPVKPLLCSSCWRWLNVPDKRYKPCKEKNVDSICDDFTLSMGHVCKDCDLFIHKHRGKTCAEKGKSPDDTACNKFVVRQDGYTLGTLSWCTIDGNLAPSINLRPGKALAVNTGSGVLLIEASGPNVFRVVPTAVKPNGDLAMAKQDNMLGYRCGSVVGIAPTGEEYLMPDNICCIDMHTPTPKKRGKKGKSAGTLHVTVGTDDQEPTEDEMHAVVDTSQSADGSHVTAQQEMPPDANAMKKMDDAPSPIAREDVGKLLANMSDLIDAGNSPKYAAITTLKRYMRTVNIDENTLRWLKKQMKVYAMKKEKGDKRATKGGGRG